MTETRGARFGVSTKPSLLDLDGVVEAERLGYGSVWLAEVGQGPNAGQGLTPLAKVLDATRSMTVGAGIINIWETPAAEAAAFFHDVQRHHPGRFVLGLGSGHVEVHGPAPRRPLAALADYVGQLRQRGVPRERIVLAALRTKSFELARDQAAGAVPGLLPLEALRRGRQILGQGPSLSVSRMVVLESDATRARQIARADFGPYAGYQNYVKAWRESGFPDLEMGQQPTDALVDALVSHGSAAKIAADLAAHLDAGADRVIIGLRPSTGDPIPALTALAHELGLTQR